MKRWHKKREHFVLALVGIIILGFLVHFGIASQAASSNIWIELNNEKVGNEILMETRSINLSMATSGVSYLDDKYIISWKIVKDEDKDVIEFQTTSDPTNTDKYTWEGQGKFNSVVKAKKPGIAQVDLYVYDKTGNDGGMTIAEHITCNIKVVFSIDTELDSAYKYVFSNDQKRSLVMYVDDFKEMNLNIGEASDEILWQSNNKDVVEMIEEDGKIYARAKGAGVTTITADGRYGSDELKVYVAPKVSSDGSDFVKNGTFSMKSGDWIYTDAVFNENRTLTIKDKLCWVISKYDESNNKVVIENSLGTVKSDLIELTPAGVDIQQNLKVQAKAGQYVIDFYPIGAYKSEKDKSDKIPVTTIILNVYANFEDREINLNAGDEFNVADSLNITTKEYLTWFEPTFLPTGYANSITYNSATGIIRADAAHGQEPIQIFLNVKKGYEDRVRTLLNQSEQTSSAIGPFKFTLRIVDELVLDQTSVRLVVGEKFQLTPSSGTYDGIYVWTSSNEKLVKVSENGIVEGLAVTTEDVTITVSQKLSDGSIKKATCKVRVVATAKDITLNHTNVQLELNQNITVLASFTPDRSEAPLKWITSDSTIASINIASDKKSVVITGKKAGFAVITAINEDNYATAVCTVTVLSPITSISLNQSQLTVKLNQEVVRLKATYDPKDATNNTLEWQSSDTSVAKVDDSGLVTLLKAGTTLITVKPTYNVSPPIMAQCLVTVLQSSQGLSLDKSKITIEVGQTEAINYLLTPVNATTKIAWSSMDTKVATVSDKGLITAKSAGKTYVVATSSDGYSATCEVTITQMATGVKLDVTNLTLGVGDSYSVLATILPVNSTDKTLTWTSQDSSIAKVTNTGKITGVSAGSTIILVKVKSGEVVYLYVNVYDVLTGLKLNPENKKINVNETLEIVPVFTPQNATNKKITWKSVDSNIATVSTQGKVKGIKGGTTVITCTAADGGYVATCIINVNEEISEVTMNPESCTLAINKTKQLSATVKSDTASIKTLKWTTSNSQIATVTKNGKVTAKKVGKCTIKAKSTDGSGEYASCSIRVIKSATGIKVNTSYVKLYEGKTKKISANITPKTATVKDIKWSTDNASVAIVDSNGKITAIKEGVTNIRVKTTDGSKKTAICTVQVMKLVPTTAITITNKDMTMIKGTSESVAVSIQPTNTTDKITYSSDNKAVATVSTKGKVSAKRPGVCSITITSSSGKQAVVNITVVGLNKTTLNLEQYDKDELWVEQITTGVKWTSSNPNIVRVTNGVVIARKVGTATIKASVKGVNLYCKVTVKKISK